MFSALVSPRITVYLLVALGLALAGMTLNHQRAARFKAEAASATEIALQLRAALTAQNKVAEECDAATEGLIAANAAQSKRVLDALTLAKTFRDNLIATREALRLQQESDRAIPECKILLDADIGICPGYALGVRKRASGLQGSSDKGPGPGTR